VKVEIRVRFNTGEFFEDFVVLYKIEFKASKSSGSIPRALSLSK